MIIQARRELLEVNASMEALAGSGTAHQVGAALQVLSLSLLPLLTRTDKHLCRKLSPSCVSGTLFLLLSLVLCPPNPLSLALSHSLCHVVNVSACSRTFPPCAPYSEHTLCFPRG